MSMLPNDSPGSAASVPPSILPPPQKSGVPNVTLPGDEYLRLLREDGKARGLAAFVIGVLSVGKFDKRVAQTIREKCVEFYPVAN